MSKKSSEIINGISLGEIIKDLYSIYADEWLAYFQYWVFAQSMKGVENFMKKIESYTIC
jgi:hypothetical protein